MSVDFEPHERVADRYWQRTSDSWPAPDDRFWRKHWHRVALALIVLVLFVATLAAAAPWKSVAGHVTKIYDGDTITVETNRGDTLRVRLADLDAPELKQAHGRASREALEALLAQDAGAVTIEYRSRDKYGRALGTVYADGVNANLAQVRNGHAWAWRARGKPTNLAAWNLEQTAREEKRGLWAAQRPQAPWDYRAMRRSAQK